MHQKQYFEGRSGLWLVVALAGLFLMAAGALPALAKQPADPAQVVWQTLTKRAVAEAWQELMGIPEREDAIVLTSAGFAVIGGQTTAPCLDILHTWTGASVGQGTLVAMHRARTAPLWFFLYDLETGFGAYLEVNGEALENLFDRRPRQIRREMAGMGSDELFTQIAVAQINYDYLMTNDGIYGGLVKDKVFGGNEFSIVGVVTGIEHDMPHDLLEAVKFHDHFCPGVSSGYFIVDYVEKNLPGDKYFYFSVPNWCKDDAVQVLMNLTPGKSGYAVTYLNQADKDSLPEDYKTLAGIMCVQNGGAWTAHALGFNWDPVYAAIPDGYPNMGKFMMNIAMLRTAPEDYVSVIKTIDLPAGAAPADYARPEVNILKAAGLVN